MSVLTPFVVRLAAVVAALVLVVVGLAWLFQRKLIYIPLDHDVPPAQSVLPGAREVLFRTDDGLELGGWFLVAPSVPAEGKAPAVLVSNGNAGNRAYRAALASVLQAQGLSVMLYDYRGYGGNPGRPSERGLTADARAARAWLESQDEVDASRVILFGESLGAAVAVALAAERAPAALVLRSPFTSMTDAGKLHYPFLPIGWLLRDRFPSIERIRNVRCPLLVVAGDSDTIVPLEQSRALFEAAGSENKRMATVPGAGHNDYDLTVGKSLTDETSAFIREVLRGKRSAPVDEE